MGIESQGCDMRTMRDEHAFNADRAIGRGPSSREPAVSDATRTASKAWHPTGGGFTIIELLVVVAIIVALIGILLPAMGRMRNSADRARTMAVLSAIQTGLQGYYNDFSIYPPSGPAYGGITAGRGSAMLAQGLMGYLGYAADGAGPDNPNANPPDPQYGFRTRRASAAMGGGGQIYGPYVPADSKMFRGSGATQYFVDPWGHEILYYRSTKTTPATQIFAAGGVGAYFNSDDCSAVTAINSATPPSGTSAFYALISGTNQSNVTGAVTGSGSYVQISAGPDETYFTGDDIVVGK
jgi:type II secretory pathway pseudopilin PulG